MTKSRTTAIDAHAGIRAAAIAAALLLSLAILLLAAGTALAGAVAGSDAAGDYVSRLARSVQARPLAAPVRVDASLDEVDWQRPSAAPLVQNDPENGVAPRQDTDWWIAYDDEALYVACRMHDSAPDSIVGVMARRDDWPNADMIVLNLDTQNDDRTGYTFAVNPSGSIYDNVMFNDGWDDPSWDGVWDCAAAVDERGWTAELRIPFDQLCFPNCPEQVWGVNLSRRVQRYQGRDDLFHRPRGESGFISRFPDLVGIAGVRPSRSIELVPYASGKGTFAGVDAGDPFHDGSDFAGASGLDLIWGLTSNLDLVATFNPDFGQVEVDPAVVSLSDFETYFPEKRPFFVEGANLYRFGSEGTNSNWGLNWMDPVVFYSRRIGRAPQLPLEDSDHADLPAATTILGAARLGGKIGGTGVGFLGAVTEGETARLYEGGVVREQLVEPRTAYSVLRLQRTREDGTRGLGLMATSTLRDLDTPLARERLAECAWAGGVDGWTTLDAGGVWALKGYLSGSLVKGSPGVLDRVQRSSRRYMQRPDAGHLGYDPSRTSLAGWCGRLMLNRQKGAWALNSAVGATSPGYEISDLGYQSRSDQANAHIVSGYRWLEPGRLFRNRVTQLALYQVWDMGGLPTSHGAILFSSAQFANYWSGWANFGYYPERYNTTLTRGGPAVNLPVAWSADIGFSSDGRKKLSFGGGYYDSRGTDESAIVQGNLWLRLRLKDSVSLTVGPNSTWHKEIAQYVTSVADEAATATAGRRYVFADMEYRSLGLSARMDWSFTPALTLQAYVQPLFAAARYSAFKELTDPHGYGFRTYGDDGASTIAYDADADEYAVAPGDGEAFAVGNPDFNVKSLKVNMVLRWEYRPGSTFYLVWTQGRADYANPGDFRLSRDAGSLLEAPAEDIVMAKVTYRLNI
ncbi:MAG: carbohydrate binding family 9 domain-containing protein [Candidatus Krumholzibacteriota bacterium]|nr:carbohydrate binding family 9 domain-containing protein [Candidatus Krumholzibacteriota bacterium]